MGKELDSKIVIVKRNPLQSALRINEKFNERYKTSNFLCK